MSTPTRKRARPSAEIDLAEKWGARVRNARQRYCDSGLTQAQLAARCEITQQSLSAIEAGENIPRDGLKLKLAQALGVPVQDLFSWNPGEERR